MIFIQLYDTLVIGCHTTPALRPTQQVFALTYPALVWFPNPLAFFKSDGDPALPNPVDKKAAPSISGSNQM